MNSDRNLHNGWLTTKILLKNFCFKILLNLCKKYFDNLCLKRVCGAVWVGRVGSEMKSLGICQHALLLWRCLMPPTWWQLYVGKYSETSLANSLLFTSAALISAKRISYRKENSRLKQLCSVSVLSFIPFHLYVFAVTARHFPCQLTEGLCWMIYF